MTARHPFNGSPGKPVGKLDHLCTCPIQRSTGEICGQPSAEDVPFPICGKHATKLYLHVSTILGDLACDPAFKAAWAVDHFEREAQKRDDRYAARTHTVYYVQVGDLIKIGYSGALKDRLRGYPPGSQLLATELGTISLERRRHAQFGHLLAAGNEWFHPGADLLDHIEQLKAAA